MNQQKLKSECAMCSVFFMEDVRKWSPYDRMMFTKHLKLHHGWVQGIVA